MIGDNIDWSPVQRVPGPVKMVTKNGYFLDEQNRVFQLVDYDGLFDEHTIYDSFYEMHYGQEPQGRFVHIESADDGTTIVINGWGDVFIHFPFEHGWIRHDHTLGAAIMHASVGDNNNYAYVAGSTASLPKYTRVNSVLNQISVSGPTKISATANLNKLYGITVTGTVQRWTGTGWATVTGKLLKYNVKAVDGIPGMNVMGIDTQNNLWRHNGIMWFHIPLPFVAKSVDVQTNPITGLNIMWAADTSGTYWRGEF